VVADAAASAARLEAAKTGKVLLTDISQADSGTAWKSTQELPPGRYRLHLLVAASPTGNTATGTVWTYLKVGDAEQAFPLQLLPGDDIPVPLALDFTSMGGKLPMSLDWQVIESKVYPKLKDERQLAIMKSGKGGGADMGGADMLGEDDDLMGLELGDGSEPVTLAQARKTPFRLMAMGMHLERLSPVVVDQVWTSKAVYTPGEAATVAITLSHVGTAPVAGTVRVERAVGLDAPTLLQELPLAIKPGGTQQIELPFATADSQWGAEIRVTVAAAGQPTAVGRGVYAVHENYYAVHQYAFVGVLGYFGEGEAARASARRLREQGVTMAEALFWAPDDMFDFTPETEQFFGCQGGYPATLTGTRDFVEACHAEGIRTCFYANWWGGGGESAMEQMRRHPEWFGNANFHTYALDDADLYGFWKSMRPGDQIRMPGGEWAYNKLRFPVNMGAFREHAREIVESHKRFGWDAIRYDSAYTASWNVRGMQVVREVVDPAVPDFRYGMNSFALGDARGLQLRNIAGGQVMAEGLRLERKRHIGKWLGECLDWRDVCWPYDVHVTPLYQHGEEAEPSPLDEVLAVSAHFAGGMHIAGQPTTPLGDLGEFSRRYAETIWDPALAAPREPTTLVQIAGAPGLMRTERMTRVASLGDDRYRLVVQLLNIPAEHTLYSGYALKPPTVHRDVVATLGLPAGATVTRAVRLDPFAADWQRELSPQGATVPVGAVAYWVVLVVDFTSPTAVPMLPDLKAQQDSIIADWRVYGPYEMPAQDKAFPGFDDLSPMTWPPPPGEGVAVQALNLPVDLQGAINPDKNDVWSWGYAWTTVISEREQDAVVYAKGDDAIAVWLDGERVLAAKTGELSKSNEAHAPIHLKAGRNEILVKVSNMWLAWEFTLRLADANNVPLTGITVEVPK